MHIRNNELKSGLINFKIRNVPYQVVKCELSPGYGFGIKNQLTNKRVDWKHNQKRWYIE